MERSFFMKKHTLALALIALMPFASVNAYEYSQVQTRYSSAPSAKTNTYKRASTSRRTGGYSNVITNNFYYGQPVAGARSYSAKPQNAQYYNAEEKQTKNITKSYSAQERKFFLAHPFFQPLQGKFGSVTDFSYAHNDFKFNILNGQVLNIDRNSSSYNTILPTGVVGISGKAETNQFAIKEDVSFGITDTLALMLMGQYDSTKTKFKDWSVPSDGSDSKSDSGFNLFGIGFQNRFVDSNDWIVMGNALFQHQKDTANTFMIGGKAGYKINRTTIYGLGNLSYTNLTKGDVYGTYVDDSTGDYLMLSYKKDKENIFMGEAGIGAFAVLNKYLTLNGEMTYGFYDWHNQLNIKGAIGIQPGDMFALNVYASAVLYDSAKNKTKTYMNYDVNPTDYPEVDGQKYFTDSKLLYTTGDYKIKDYNEWKIGVQAILYF